MPRGAPGLFPQLNENAMNYTLNEWWASLTVAEKQRIASKVAGREVVYPECTVVWNSLEEEKQRWIHDHCTAAHGLEIKEWTVDENFSC